MPALERTRRHLQEAGLPQLPARQSQRPQPVGLRRMATISVALAQRSQRVGQIVHTESSCRLVAL